MTDTTEKTTWTLDDLSSWLGEGIHTMLRKGCDSPEAHTLWVAINDCPDWGKAVGGAAYYLADVINKGLVIEK